MCCFLFRPFNLHKGHPCSTGLESCSLATTKPLQASGHSSLLLPAFYLWRLKCSSIIPLLSSSLDFCISPSMWAAFLAKSLLFGRGVGAEEALSKTQTNSFLRFIFTVLVRIQPACVWQGDWEEIANCRGGSPTWSLPGQLFPGHLLFLWGQRSILPWGLLGLEAQIRKHDQNMLFSWYPWPSSECSPWCNLFFCCSFFSCLQWFDDQPAAGWAMLNCMHQPGNRWG